MIHYAAMTDKGVREENEDRVLVGGVILDSREKTGAAESPFLAVVCDGVGGEAFGAEAAQLGVETILMAEPICSEAAAEEAARQMNEAIIRAQKQDSVHKNMACTLAGASVFDTTVLIFNVGDSKVYRFRNPYIAQLSVDHTYAKEVLMLGLVADESDLSEESRHRLTRCLGDESAWQPDIYKGKVRAKDIYLVCSDGLSDVVDNNTMEKILAQPASAKTKCSHLMALADGLGSQDNISIIILEVE